MDWLFAIAAIVTPIGAFLGCFVTAKFTYKSAIAKLHAEEKETLHKSFESRLDGIDGTLADIQKEQLRMGLLITGLQNDVQKHNNVIERTYNLEREVAIIKTELHKGA